MLSCAHVREHSEDAERIVFMLVPLNHLHFLTLPLLIMGNFSIKFHFKCSEYSDWY